MKSILSIIFALIILSSCTTRKRNKAHNYFRDHPQELAELCAKEFPPVINHIQGKTDTIPGINVYIKGDSIPCPDGTKVKAPDVKVPCPPSTHRVDTVTIENTAKIKALEGESKNKDARISELEKELTETKEKASNRMWWLISIGLFFALLIALWFWRITRLRR